MLVQHYLEAFHWIKLFNYVTNTESWSASVFFNIRLYNCHDYMFFLFIYTF